MTQTGGGIGTRWGGAARALAADPRRAGHGFPERGYAHASMAAIAQRAEIPMPLVYEYFGPKDMSARCNRIIAAPATAGRQ